MLVRFLHYFTGHPFPLKGRFYASLFIHFEPTGHSLGRNEAGYFYVKDDEEMKAAQEAGRKVRGGRNSVKNTAKTQQNVDEQYREDTSQGFGGQSSSYGGLPPYIKRETPEEEHWLVYHPTGWQQVRTKEELGFE